MPDESHSSKKLLYVYYGKLSRHGIDLTVHHQVTGLAQENYHLDLVSRGTFSNPNITNYGPHHTPANLISFLSKPYYYGAQYRWASWWAAQKLSPQHHSAVIAWTGSALAVFQKAKSYGIPCILNCTNFHCDSLDPYETETQWPAITKKLRKEEYDLADCLTVGSQPTADSFAIQGIDPKKITVIGRGFDPSHAQPTTYPNDCFRLIFCGRAIDRKGILEVLRAWRQANIDNGELWIVGEIPHEMKTAIEKEATPSVQFHGFCKNVWEKMSQCHAQILLSRNEAIAKSLVEGASCGLATIATPESGLSIEEGKTGFLVDRKQIDVIAEKILFLANNPSKCKVMGQNGKEFVNNNLTWTNVSQRFNAVLETFVT